MPRQITRLNRSWLKDRVFYCEVGGKVSAMVQLDYGTVQGSILGPVLFTLFVSPLGDIIENLTSYADDSYHVSYGGTYQQSLETSVQNVEKMIKWLTEIGLAVNKKEN